MTATVTIEIARATAVLRVPNAALRVRPPSTAVAPAGEDSPRGRVVWLVAEGGLHAIPVRVGISDGSYSAVEGESLSEGAQVVTSIATGSSSGETQGTSPLLPFGGRVPGGGRGGQRPQR
jgi:HlyD family secretion protein